MLGQATGVKMQHVPYLGGAPLMTVLLGGPLPTGIDTPAEFAENHSAGKLKILALSGNQRLSQLPEIPTLREQGVNLEASTCFGIFCPAGIPATRTEALSSALMAALRQPDVVSKLAGLGLQAAPESSADMVKRLATDKARWQPVIKFTGFQAD